MKGDDG